MPIKTILAGNKINKIKAILNGTTNYILTKMEEENISYEECLKKAQELGYAETDPTGDVEGYEFDKQFDCIVVYNAFPHFPNPDTLICCLAGLLRKGGKLTIAHGMSRAQLDDHHNDVAAQQISNGLMPASWLNEIFAKYLKVTKIIDSTFYQVVGKK